MTTPRSPIAATVLHRSDNRREGEGSSRKLDDTSFESEDQGAKAQKMEVEQPPWKVLLAKMEELAEGQRATNEKLDVWTEKVANLEEKVAEGAEERANLLEIVNELRLENATLRGNFENLRADLDRQTDNDLREHLIFYGVPGSEKTWEESAKRLAKWLFQNVGVRTENQYDDAIWRCHRGPGKPGERGPLPMFVKMNYRYVDFIKGKMKFGAIGGVTIREQYSTNTQARVNEALAFRKDWKSRHVGSKAYIKFPATVKVCEANSTGYKVEKIF